MIRSTRFVQASQLGNPSPSPDTMKLRIRSTETNETLRIEIADTASLHDLKTLVATRLSSPSSAITAGSIHLSLNRKDELLSPSPGDPLRSLSLTSGDLLFFTVDSSASATLTLTLTPTPIAEHPSVTKPMDQSDETLGSDHQGSSSSSAPEVVPMEIDSDFELPVIKNLPSIPCFLKRVMEAEGGEGKGDLSRMVLVIHAVFLESGFVIPGVDGSCLPRGWAAGAVSIQYTASAIVGRNDVKSAFLKVSAMGKYASVYGFVTGDCPSVYRLCLDAPKLVSSLPSDLDAMGAKEEKDVFQLWKMVKDGLALPLLIDFCIENGLNLPPCFVLLPTELKVKVLKLLPGVDVARVGCSSSELRYLSSDDGLWKQKFVEEFGSLDQKGLVGRNWKERFARCWMKKKDAMKRTETMYGIGAWEDIYRMPRNNFLPRNGPFGPQRFPVIGGDYDLFPARGGGLGSRASRVIYHLPGRRNFSPHCNLGGHHDDLSKTVTMNGIREREDIYGVPHNNSFPRNDAFRPPQFPGIGRYYDHFPAIGDSFGSRAPRTGFPQIPGWRNLSLHCNLGGHDDDSAFERFL